VRTTHPLHYLIKAADAGRATFFINQLDPHQMRRFKFSKSASLIKNLPWPADKRAAPAIYSPPLSSPAHNPREYLITGLRPLSPIMWRGRKQTHLCLSSRPAGSVALQNKFRAKNRPRYFFFQVVSIKRRPIYSLCRRVHTPRKVFGTLARKSCGTCA
jgi:hypothetical protein